MIEKRSSANEFAFSILGSGFGFNNAKLENLKVSTPLSLL